jgi:hypothetical protein
VQNSGNTFVKKLTEKRLSVVQACKAAERESGGIPAETIRSWWKQIQIPIKKVGENSPTHTTTSINSENQLSEDLPVVPNHTLTY